jgi:hypothetical protein
VRRAGLLCGVAVLAAGCGGGSLSGTSTTAHKNADGLSAYGMGVDLPKGWTGRIVLGAAGRPVLHAASFPLSANDDDSGAIAKESIGTADAIYLNVRNVGAGGAPLALPVAFAADDFARVDGGCCRVTQASRDAAVNGERFRITAISGGDGGPSAAMLARANDVLKSLSLEPYMPVPVAALPPDARVIGSHGVSMRLPSGWDGEAKRGELDASSGGISLKLLEHADDGGFVTGRVPIELTPAEFLAPGAGSDPRIPAESGRSFVVNGRQFVLWASADTLPPSTDAIREANEALASLKVEAGNFYPGTVQPAAFSAADGWDTGTSGAAKVQPDGQQTWTWASTVPYRDEPFQFLPHKTLAALPPGGIVIDVQLLGPDQRPSAAKSPLQIAPADGPGSMEGLTPPYSLYSTGGRVAGQDYDADVSVLFGREHPTAEQFARANAELARLELPRWPSVGG